MHAFSSRRVIAPRRGFALLITITLVAFLVLIVVTIASLTRVETQVASNSQTLLQARQNALMALNIALGELQRTAGPDQRVTATADLLAGTDPAKTRWTGVWATVDDPATATDETTTPTWLVSAPSGASPDASTAGLEQADIDDGNAVRLVTNRSANAADPGDEIIVPLVELRSDVPGFPNNQLIGKMGWWVADESVKASVSLRDPYDQTGVATPDNDAELSRLRVAQRTAPEAIAKFAAIPTNSADLEKLLSMDQLPMVTGNTPDDLTAARESFFDLTSAARGVLADTRDGGLRRDLTRGLAAGSAQPSGDIGTSGIPWERLRDYYALAGQNSLTPRVGESPITPVIVGVEEWLGLYFEEIPAVPPALEPTYDVYLAYTGKLVLWNPYNVPLDAANYTFQTDYPSGAGIELAVVPNPTTGATFANRGPFYFHNNQYLNADNLPIRGTAGGSAVWDFDWLRFSTPTPVGFAAGEVKVLTVAPPSGDYVSRYTGIQDTPMAALVEGFPGVSFITIRHPRAEMQNVPQEVVRDGRWRLNSESNSTTATAQSRLRSFRDPAGSTSLGRDIWVYPRHRRVALRLGDDLVTQLARPTSASRARENLFEAYADVGRVAGYHNNRLYSGVAGGMMENRLQNVLDAIAPIPELARGSDDDNNFVYAYDTPPLVRSNARATDDSWIRRHRADINQNALHLTRVAPWGNAGNDEAFIDLSGAENFFNIRHDGSGSRSWWGSSRRDGGELGNDTLRLFDIPENAPYSIGALRHALLTTERYQPTYIIGNSHVDTFPARREAPDLAFLVNDGLWDGYFFSSVPANLAELPDAATPLPNSRLIAAPDADLDDLKTYEGASTNLLINGVFNVNSTSVDAWVAHLASTLGVIEHSESEEPVVAVPRVQPRAVGEDAYAPYLSDEATFALNAGSINGVSSSPGHSTRPRLKLWDGNRVLTLDEVRVLAEEIVEQVRLRGPFRSLADFVNREPNQTGQRRVTGALQAAIDNTEIAGRTAPGAIPADFTPIAKFYRGLNRDSVANDFRWGGNPGQRHSGSTRPVTIDGQEFSFPLSTDAPGYLAQHDLLALLGPTLAVRGDTFLIRAYGENLNPATQAVESKAWVEATVQRLPQTIDPTVDPRDNATDLGRRFVITQLRWLNENDL